MARMDGEERAKPQNGRRSAKENWCKLRCLWNWGKKLTRKKHIVTFITPFIGEEKTNLKFLAIFLFLLFLVTAL
jgi:hypothetical protein